MVHVETMGNVYAMMTTMEVTAQVNLDFLLFYWSNITLKIWFYCIKFFIQCHSFFAFFIQLHVKLQPIAMVMEPAEVMAPVNVTVIFLELIVQVSYKILIILRFRSRFSYHSRALKSGSELRAALAILSLS